MTEQPTLSRDGRQAYLMATLKTSADEDDVVAGLEKRFPDDSGVLLGGPVFAQKQIGDSVSECDDRLRQCGVPASGDTRGRCIPKPRVGARLRPGRRRRPQKQHERAAHRGDRGTEALHAGVWTHWH